jgi:thioesterase domain-containing protein
MMQLNIKEYNITELITTAPLEINTNDKGTAFGASLSTMTIISAWSLCWLISKELGFDSEKIEVIKDENSYLKPVTKDIICHTIKPNKTEIKTLKQKLVTKGSASLKITSKIIEDDGVCVEFDGVYVIKL